VERQPLDHVEILNFAAKYLARRPRAPISEYAEPWRFPLVDSYRTGKDITSEYSLNRVTFVWIADTSADLTPLSVVGTFDNLWDSTPLDPVMFDDEPTPYRAATIVVPKGQVHTYKFLRSGTAVLDPINPQRMTLDNGVEWSRFFTDQCITPLSFERWELAILVRLSNEILPFNSSDAQDFMNLFYFNSDKQARNSAFSQAYRLEQPIGAVNFIDNIVAREERHHLIDYKICLGLINGLLRRRFPGLTPEQVSKDGYQDLYKEMAAGSVDGWDTGQYQNPNYFLQLLRRHSYTGAFSHPKYGGNIGGAGWAYLEQNYVGPHGESCFNWERSIEPPLGASRDYFA
jgi:Gluconate 2-dehydrogenase subunit 3